jgi:Protein of unknown function DUF262
MRSSMLHDDSKQNITSNYTAIESWFKKLSDKEKSEFKEYALFNCQFVIIELADLSEAFQLFDSQNARGKPLEPYDLLKAFHLREMFLNTPQEKLSCVKTWEDSIDNRLLKPTLAEFLFRIRKWAKGEDAGYFTKEDIDEFKGINLSKFKAFPYLKPYLMNDSLVEEIQSNAVNQALNLTVPYPFQITQMILNGKRFFEYVNFYTTTYSNIFTKQNSDFLIFYNENCNYEGSGGTGDTYVRQLFEALIICYFDKFGSSDFEVFYRLLYKYAYILRLKQYSVRYNSIDKYLRENNNPFKLIENAYYPFELYGAKINSEKPDLIKHSVPQIEKQFNL